MHGFAEDSLSVAAIDQTETVSDGGARRDGESGAERDAELGQYLPQLGTMREQLKQTSKQIEESVVGVCDSFQAIAMRARATVTRAVGFLGSDAPTDGRSQGKASFEVLIESCGGTLVKIMDTISEASEVSCRAVERIRQMDDASRQISAALTQLDEIAKGNRMLAMNARIEAAHVGVQGAGFTVVAVELAAQTSKSRAVTAEVGELAMNLRRLAESTVADLERMRSKDAERVEQCRTEVDTSLQELQAAHGEMAELLQGMTEDGAVLAADIGAAVRGMQFQDRVAQRIAHVVEELDGLQARLARHRAPGTGGAGSDLVWDGQDAADKGLSSYTMREEREAAGLHEVEAPAGDVELF